MKLKMIAHAGLSFLVAAVLAWSSQAAPVPADDVVTAARGWLALSDAAPLGDSMGTGLAFMTPGTDAKGKLLYYAINLEKGGVLVMAADDAIEPVIAFSPEAGDLADPDPCNHLRLMVEADLADRLADVRAGKVKNADVKAAKWAMLMAAARDPAGVKAGLGIVSDVRVSPLTSSKWSQSYIYSGSTKVAVYNYYTPPYGEGNALNYYCGCVATTFAQLMYYHKYPKTGVGTASKPITVSGVDKMRRLRGGDGAGGAYDWANMPADVKSVKLSTTQRKAIGALCADAGVANKMEYWSDGSSAPLCWYAGGHPLQKIFKFGNVETPWVDVSLTFPKAEVNQALNPSLDAGLPAAIAINNNRGGHAVVVDGYGYASGTLYHHLNMGWGGVDNAWYNLPTVDATSESYFRITGLLFNLSPTQSGFSLISGRILDSAGKPVAGVRVVAKDLGGYYPNVAALSNAKGIYAIKASPGNYRVTGYLPDYGFSPVSRDVSVGYVRARNVWAANFTRVTRIIRLSTTKMVFGAVPVSSKKTINFTIFNDGTAPLSITSITGPAGFSAVMLPPANGAMKVAVTFAPTVAGYVKGTLTVVCNKSGGVNTLIVMGTGQ